MSRLYRWLKRLLGLYRNRRKNSRIRYLLGYLQEVNRPARRLR